MFRKTDKKVLKFLDGAPNPQARVLGGVLVKGPIERDVTVNLVALRGIRGKDNEETKRIQKYLLGLALVAATAEFDLSLREGCHLRYAGEDAWYAVPRRGDPTSVPLGAARKVITTYASEAAKHFKKQWPKGLEHKFNVKDAMKLLAKKDDESPDED